MQWNLLKRGVLMGGLFAFSLAGFAQQLYPNRPVKIIVPFAASGPADNYARFMAQAPTRGARSKLCGGQPPWCWLHHRYRCGGQVCARWLHLADDVERANRE